MKIFNSGAWISAALNERGNWKIIKESFLWINRKASELCLGLEEKTSRLEYNTSEKCKEKPLVSRQKIWNFCGFEWCSVIYQSISRCLWQSGWVIPHSECVQAERFKLAVKCGIISVKAAGKFSYYSLIWAYLAFNGMENRREFFIPRSDFNSLTSWFKINFLVLVSVDLSAV